MRSYAVIPPMLLDARERQLRFSNNNGLIEDPMPEYKDRQMFNMWSQAEKDMFKERFLQHPKNFGYIATFLERKVGISQVSEGKRVLRFTVFYHDTSTTNCFRPVLWGKKENITNVKIYVFHVLV